MQDIILSIETTKDFLFKPTEMAINVIGGKETEDGKVFDVLIRLTQETANGSIVETSRRAFPSEQLNAVLGGGYDFDKQVPIVDKEAIAPILAAFNLKINEAK